MHVIPRAARYAWYFARVRAAPIGVMHETGLGTTPLDRHLEGRQRQPAIIHGTDRHPMTNRE
jgi:hypothetical protein